MTASHVTATILAASVGLTTAVGTAQGQPLQPAAFAADSQRASREAVRLQILNDEETAERARLAAARIRVQARVSAGDPHGAQEAQSAVSRHEFALQSLGREIAAMQGSVGNPPPHRADRNPLRSGPGSALAVPALAPVPPSASPPWWDLYGASVRPTAHNPQP